MKSHNPEIVVQVKTLHKSFAGQTVLNGIDLEVVRGETLAVLGRSGTGKSVLLKLIVGLQEPDSGCISILGKEITSLQLDQLNEIRKKIGFLFQSAALYDSLTVEDNVAFPLKRHTDMPAARRKEKVRELLSEVGLEQDLEKMPGDISGGMQKRVGLARALALDPEILLFDEPTSGLDPISAGEIGELILRLQQERRTASIVVTHDVRSARTVSDRLALMQDGKILIQGTFEDLRANDNTFVAHFLENGS